MGKRDEHNEKAMLAMSLRRQGMTIVQIARYFNETERNVYKLLARAKKLWALLVDASDSKTRIGENLNAFEEMERAALEKFAKCKNHESTVAVAYLNAARDARREIKRLQQEAGLMVKMAEEIKITGLPLALPEARLAALEFLKTINKLSEKKDEE
ncbi:MAG: hypothetical protein PHX53_09380 [Syntrophales bacterium]|nr:hypothetical protein [Syntrophales bacterium]